MAGLQRDHYYEARDQWMLHFDAKRGTSGEIPVAHDLKVLFDEYLERTGIKHERRKREPATGSLRAHLPFQGQRLDGADGLRITR